MQKKMNIYFYIKRWIADWADILYMLNSPIAIQSIMGICNVVRHNTLEIYV